MKTIISLVAICAALSLVGCANQGHTAATTPATHAEQGVAAAGLSGGGGGGPQMRHTPTKNLP
jgi:uncharacterized lipoprotein NlpE involved in copper resistance